MKIKIFSVTLLLALLLVALPMGSSTAQAAPCYQAKFIADVTVPDGTSFAANATFTKTWRLRNIGACAWTSGDVSLIFDSGERMNAPASLLLPATVYQGETADITVSMTAPSISGHYFGYWKLNSNSGGPFGIGYQANRSFWVEIFVVSPIDTGYDFTANASLATWASGAGYLSFPGVDGSSTGFGIKRDTPIMENGVTAAQAGLLFSPQNVRNGYLQAAYPALHVQTGDRFRATIGCEYGANNCYVTYKLYYQIGAGPIKTYWTFNEKYEGWVYNVNLDLSPLANQEVKFILAIHAHGSAYGDRALWVNPIISRVGVVSIPSITPSPFSDLTISNVYLAMQGIPESSPNCVPNYGSYEIRATIQNRGETQAVNISVVETSTGSQSKIGLLRAGQSMEVYFPATSPYATYNLVVDPQNTIPELDENNNYFSYPAVTPTPPVLCTPVVAPTFTPTPTPVPPTNSMLIWQSTNTPCKTASFWADHMSYNYCPPSLSPITIVPYTQMPAYSSRLSIWMTAYAPFTVQTLAGLVTFNGGGYVIAIPAEQRMIAEWATRMFNDASGGNPSPSSTPVVSGHFSGDNMCYDISVYRDGQYVVVSCLPSYNYPNPKGYLNANELLYFYRWMDTLQPFQDTSPYRTISFAWNGGRPVTFGETLSMQTLVYNLERRAAGTTPESGGGVPVPALLSENVLANQLGILPEQIQVSNIEPVNYPDACLGTGASPCEPVAVSGYRILLIAQNMLYEFHTDSYGYDIRQFGSPQPAPQGAGG